MSARKQGRMPTEGEWRKAQRAAQREADRTDGADSIWSRLRARIHRDR